MKFPQYDFDSMKEPDVREDIIMPLLREIGYRKGSENDIIREQLLRYPRVYLGRKKTNDPMLRGKADYICEVRNKTRWIVEAKSPSESIDDVDTIDQAWSYANHPEVRAVYLCICNGLNFSIYQTNKGMGAPVIFECAYKEMESNLDVIKNILSPDAILRDYPTYRPDYGRPLAPNLRSFAQLTNGRIIFETNSLNFRPFNGMVTTIASGSVERSKDKKIEAYIKTQSPNQQLQKINEQLGLHEFSLETDDYVISTNPDVPTVLVGKNEMILPRGVKILDLKTWQEVALPMDISVITETIATGYLEGKTFTGTFVGKLFYKEMQMSVQLDGVFDAQID